MAQVSVIGAGYVGLVTAAGLAELGHRVRTIELDGRKVAALQQGVIPIREEGLEAIWNEHLRTGTLTITDSYPEGLEGAEFIFICVGTPSREDGDADLSYVLSAARSIGEHAEGNPIVVIKSTVPVGTAGLVARTLREARNGKGALRVVSNPEFLREGRAVQDFLHPDRIIIGSDAPENAEPVAALYQKLQAPLIITRSATAEMTKYASNVFLAAKISFINELAALCEPVGVDIQDVARGIGLDHRIGPHFLGAGLGWGGSCLPKDTKALLALARGLGQDTPMVSAVLHINAQQPSRVVAKLDALLDGLDGQTIALWGLTFKENTDDFRDSPAITLAQLLMERGCRVQAHDPIASEQGIEPVAGLHYSASPYEAAQGAAAVVVATAWPAFLQVDLEKVRSGMTGDVFLDARNAFAPGEVRRLGFRYEGIGRSSNGSALSTSPAHAEAAATVTR